MGNGIKGNFLKSVFHGLVMTVQSYELSSMINSPLYLRSKNKKKIEEDTIKTSVGKA